MRTCVVRDVRQAYVKNQMGIAQDVKLDIGIHNAIKNAAQDVNRSYVKKQMDTARNVIQGTGDTCVTNNVQMVANSSVSRTMDIV